MSMNYLKNFAEGEVIKASETNANNQFLLEKISDNASDIQSTVNSQIANIKSSVASMQTTLQNNINKKLDKAVVSSYLIEEYRNGYNWYRIYSNKWCVQGGKKTGTFNQTNKHTLLRAYPSTNYSIIPICNISTGLYGKEKDGFYVIGQSGKYAGDYYSTVEWIAAGFLA